jgi:hypothetical protein
MQTLLKNVADFETQLAAPVSASDTTATLVSVTDDDGNPLANGNYCLTVDLNSASKEYFTCTLTGIDLTNIKSITRQGVSSTGFARAHRRGAKIVITDWVIIDRITDLLDGSTDFDAGTPLAYDGEADMTGDTNKFATVKYVNDTAVAGAPDASTTVKGIVQEATQGEVDAGTATGSTGARLFVNPSTLDSWQKNASTTVKGVVEIATTEEITAGDTTGGTGARLVVPADAVGAPGAGKLVQFDVTGKYPAADGSEITNLPNFAVHTVNADERFNEFQTYQFPIVFTAATTALPWTLSNLSTSSGTNQGLGYVRLASSFSTSFTISGQLPGSSNQIIYRYNDAKDIKIKFRARFEDTSDRKGYGLCITAADIHTAHTDTTNGLIRFILNGSTLYAHNANGTATSTDVSAGITVTNWNTYEIVFNPGTDIKYYINGNLVATHTTNLPTTGDPFLCTGANANGRGVQTTYPVVSIEN